VLTDCAWVCRVGGFQGTAAAEADGSRAGGPRGGEGKAAGPEYMRLARVPARSATRVKLRQMIKFIRMA
jgi:hypothetical protein